MDGVAREADSGQEDRTGHLQEVRAHRQLLPLRCNRRHGVDCEELGIEGKTKFAQYFVLCELYHKHEATLTEIADAISVAIPNVSNTAAELIELGLAERASDSGDRRKSIIRITPEGLRFSEIIIPRCLDIANTVGGDEDEAQQLLNHYDVVLKRIEQHKAGRSIE